MELSEVLDRARSVSRAVIAEDAAAIDREGRWPERGMRALQDAGLGGLAVPGRHGGLGQGLVTLARVCEIIGRECASTALCYGMHVVGSAVLAAKAKSGHVEMLETIAAGRHLTTLALSEPGTGAHFYYPQTALVSDGEGFRVTGRKHFVTNGGHADSYVISTVATDPDAPAHEFSCVVIPSDARGLEWGEPWQGLGMRGNASRSLDLRDVRLPREALLGEEGDQIWYVFQVVAPFFLLAMAGTYLGVAAAAFDEARAHLGHRRFSHSGAKLAELSVLQHRLGVLWTGLERTRRLVYFAADEADSGGSDALPALCAAKADVARCVVDTVNEAMTLCGGIAYREGDRFGRLLRDARAAHVMSPTTDLLFTWAGRALLDQPLLGE